MPMFPVQQFPILTPGQMNPMNQALSSALETYQNVIGAGYARPKLQADIAAKQAYANNYQRQIAAQVLSNPAAIAKMTDPQINALLDQMNNRALNTGQSSGNNSQHPGGIFGFIQDLFHGSQNQQQPSQTVNQSVQPDVEQGNNSNTQNMGENNRASESEIHDIAQNGNNNYNPATPASQLRQRAQQQLSGDITTGSGKGVGAGTTYVDPNTGVAKSSASNAVTNSIQTGIVTTERMEPFIKNIATSYKESYGLGADIKRGIEGIHSYLSGGGKTPTISSKARYESALTNSADAMLKELGLNNTTGNVTRMAKAMEAMPGESPDSYAERINELYTILKSRDAAGRKILLEGIKLNPTLVQSNEGMSRLNSMSKHADTLNKADNKNKNIMTWNHRTRRVE